MRMYVYKPIINILLYDKNDKDDKKGDSLDPGNEETEECWDLEETGDK